MIINHNRTRIIKGNVSHPVHAHDGRKLLERLTWILSNKLEKFSLNFSRCARVDLNNIIIVDLERAKNFPLSLCIIFKWSFLGFFLLCLQTSCYNRCC